MVSEKVGAVLATSGDF